MQNFALKYPMPRQKHSRNLLILLGGQGKFFVGWLKSGIKIIMRRSSYLRVGRYLDFLTGVTHPPHSPSPQDPSVVGFAASIEPNHTWCLGAYQSEQLTSKIVWILVMCSRLTAHEKYNLYPFWLSSLLAYYFLDLDLSARVVLGYISLPVSRTSQCLWM
jgi:hypothetical protein